MTDSILRAPEGVLGGGWCYRLSGAAIAVGVALGFFSSATPAEAQTAELPTLAQYGPARGEGVLERQQERKRSDEFAPIGARVGSFIFLPAVEVDAEFNSNVFAVENGDQGDFLTRIRPEFALESDWNNHKLDLNIIPEFVRYYRFTSDSVENVDAAVDGRIDILRELTVSLNAGYRFGHEDRGNPNAVAAASSPTEIVTSDGSVGIEYKPARYSLSLDGSFTHADFGDVVNNNDTITNNDDRDRKKKEFIGRFGYEYLPETEMFVKASYNVIDYDDSVDDGGQNRDSDGFSVVFGTDLDFTGIVTGDVFAGYISQDYDDVTLETVAGPTFGLGVSWDATPLITARASIVRTIQETTLANTGGFLSTGSTISVDYEILRQWTASAEAKWTKSKYEGIGREDNTYDLSLGSEYLLNRNFSLRFDYAYKRKLSSQTGVNYKQNTVLVSLRSQF